MRKALLGPRGSAVQPECACARRVGGGGARGSSLEGTSGAGSRSGKRGVQVMCGLVCVEGNGNPLQYSCLGNPMDKEAWQAPVPRVTKKSQTRLSD